MRILKISLQLKSVKHKNGFFAATIMRSQCKVNPFSETAGPSTETVADLQLI